jgi:hypothetical protein
MPSPSWKLEAEFACSHPPSTSTLSLSLSAFPFPCLCLLLMLFCLLLLLLLLNYNDNARDDPPAGRTIGKVPSGGTPYTIRNK